MSSKSAEFGGFMLADDWKLFPVDERNWELCHRYASTKGKDVGTVKWHRCGRFYQYNTIDQAMLYVIDVLMKDGCRDQALALEDAMGRWHEIAESVRQGVAR